MKTNNWMKGYKCRYLYIGAYMASLCVIYILVMSPLYSYSLLTTNINYKKFIISLVLAAITISVIPTDENKPSTYLYYIFFSITYLPTLCYYWLNDQETSYIVVETIGFILISIIIRLRLAKFTIKIEKSKIIISSLFVLYVISIIYLIVQNGGLNIKGLLNDLYAVRANNNLSGISGYLLNWCAKSFMPMFFALFYLKKNYIGTTLVCIFQCAIFATYGFKAFIIAVIMIIGVSILMKNENTFHRNFTVLLFLGNLIALILSLMGITNMVMQLFSYRTLIVPAQGQYEYFTFFNHHDHLWFSEGSIGSLLGIEYPYDQTIGRVVNNYIYGPWKNSNGNTGVFSYGFADCGFIGMILVSIIIGLIFVVVDNETKKLPLIVPVSAMAYQMFVMNDSNIMISLNTGGILLTILLLAIFNSYYLEKSKSNYNEHIRTVRENT